MGVRMAVKTRRDSNKSEAEGDASKEAGRLDGTHNLRSKFDQPEGRQVSQQSEAQGWRKTGVRRVRCAHAATQPCSCKRWRASRAWMDVGLLWCAAVPYMSGVGGETSTVERELEGTYGTVAAAHHASSALV